LRERISDIPLLVEHYLNLFNEQTSKQVERFDEMALHALQTYHWPGNVRELVNVIERAVVLAKSNVVTPSDLPDCFERRETESYVLEDGGDGSSLKAALAQPERQLILDALETNGWNRQNTARLLGINRTTLYKKMKKYSIDFEKQLK
jgi:DNA-binding NtrC family response regulator